METALQQSNKPLLNPPSKPGVDVLIIAGEHSGDEHAAELVKDLLAQRPGLNICALGGKELAAAGADVLFNLTAHSVVGFAEVLKKYGFFKALMGETLNWVAQHKPKCICFVDYPGFNLRIAKQLFESGLAAKAGGPVQLVQYISPQIWAWKAKRRFKMAQYLNSVGTILPFEVACYADTTLKDAVHFVGHPFLKENYQSPVQYAPYSVETGSGAPLLVLPGSRHAAVGRIFPLQLRAYAALAQTLRAQGQVPPPVTVLYPNTALKHQLQSIIKDTFKFNKGNDASAASAENLTENLAANITLKPAFPNFEAGQAPHTASAVLTSSGTISLCCALAGIPGAIVYRAHPFTYIMGRALVSIKYLGLNNLLLNKPAYPEFLQGAAKPATLAKTLQACLGSGGGGPASAAQAAEDAKALRTALTAENKGPAAWLSGFIKG